MKLLLVGPYPPPHGGVSVHVRSLRQAMEQKGIRCRVVNVDPRAGASAHYIKINGAVDLIREIGNYSWDGWTVHVHTNGHNWKSWLVALVSAVMAQGGCGCMLTLHSGILPGYLRTGRLPRLLAWLACRLYDRIICVNEEILETLVSIGVAREKLEVREAYLESPAARADVPADLAAWMKSRSPLLSTTMLVRPEYGYEVLQTALGRLRNQHPNIGCVVMGVAGKSTDDSMWHAGDVDHDLCLSVMSQSKVFVRPTLQDGDSISVREAHAAGIPVVASNVGTRPPGTLLFEPGDVAGLVDRLTNVFSAGPDCQERIGPGQTSKPMRADQ